MAGRPTWDALDAYQVGPPVLDGMRPKSILRRLSGIRVLEIGAALDPVDVHDIIFDVEDEQHAVVTTTCNAQSEPFVGHGFPDCPEVGEGLPGNTITDRRWRKIPLSGPNSAV
jgi:hypothetical protein